MVKLLNLVMIVYDGFFIIHQKMTRHTTNYVIYMKTEDENEIEHFYFFTNNEVKDIE